MDPYFRAFPVCAVLFSTGELRMSTWSGINYARWCCVGCFAGTIPSLAEIVPFAKATDEHVTPARSAISDTPEIAQPTDLNEPEACSNMCRHPAWDAGQLPCKEWWTELNWSELHALRAGTFTRLPERRLPGCPAQGFEGPRRSKTRR